MAATPTEFPEERNSGAIGSGKAGGWLAAAGMYAGCLVVGSSTIWLGDENPATLVVAAAGLGMVYFITRKIKVLDPAPVE